MGYVELGRALGGAAALLSLAALGGCASDTWSMELAAPGPAPGFRYVSRPTSADLLAAYPAQALAAGMPGYTLTECLIQPSGRFTDCFVVEERPAGRGFGAASVAIMAKFQVGKAHSNAVMPEQAARVRIPIHWKLG